jgi:DNA-binding SARP family transcriptional activator
VELRVLGPFAVILDDGSRLSPARRERQLAALLLLRAGQPCGREMLVRALWPDRPPARPAAALSVCVSRARRALGPPGLITTVPGGYRADPPPGSLDLDLYLRLRRAAARAAARRELDEASRILREALDWWGDPPLADLPDAPEVAADAGRLLDMRAQDELTLTDIRLRLGLHEQVLPELQARVIADPSCERAWEHLVLALSRAGRRPEALAAWGRARDALTAPGEGLQAMLGALIGGQALEPARRPPPASWPALPSV